ncbi:MAG: DUF885 domain-containing protein [Sphingomicrobium sp.]
MKQRGVAALLWRPFSHYPCQSGNHDEIAHALTPTGGRLTASVLAAAIAFATPAGAAPPRLAAALHNALQSPHARLFSLFRASDEAALRRNPLQALYRGDLRFAHGLGDLFSDAHFQGERKAAEQDLAALAAIPRDQLSPTDQLAYDAFDYTTRDTLRGLAPNLLKISEALPMNHFYGLHNDFPTIASGQSGGRFATPADYDEALRRNRDFATNIDIAIGQWRKGMADNIVDTRLTVRNMIEQLDDQLKLKPEASPYWIPVQAIPRTIAPADKARIVSQYRQSLGTIVYPALQRMRDFLANDYLPKARDGAGLMYITGGDQLYNYLVQSATTTELTPDEVHRLGLAEVARITGQFEQVKGEIGFTGDLHAFFDYMRTDPRFQPKSGAQMTVDYYRLKTAVEAKSQQYFSKIPKTQLVIRPYPQARERYEAAAAYDAGTLEGSRPGTFYFNTYDLPSRSTWDQTTLFLHEGEPGHHFQISLAQENPALPAFMRFGGNTAYVEGWALYAETLGYDMGLYKDPYQRFGTLNDEMLRALRLVVDTGIHTKGWTRQQAIDYLLANSGMGRTDATAEVERYIAIPGQATAYKVGALTIQRLRHKAQDALGPRFDIRDFHAQVLDSGALPLAVLEAKIDRWIAQVKAAEPPHHSRRGAQVRG